MTHARAPSPTLTTGPRAASRLGPAAALGAALAVGCDSTTAPDAACPTPPADVTAPSPDAANDLGASDAAAPPLDVASDGDALDAAREAGTSDAARPDGTIAPAAELDVPEGLIVASAENHIVRPARRGFTEALVPRITVPAGFRVGVFARGLTEPRVLAAAPGGGVYVSEREAGRVTLLRDADGDGRAEVTRAVAMGLGQGRGGVHGLAVRGNQLFMVTDTRLYVAAIQADGALGAPTLLQGDLPAPGQHPNRTLGVAPDGTLFLSVGSPCNACPPVAREDATLVTVSADGRTRAVFTSGLRNTIGFAWHPVTGQLWGFDHGSDGRGDDTPPEELNRLQSGRHYGWPYCHGARVPDLLTSQDPPNGSRGAFCPTTEPAALTYQAHSAPMQMVYYTGAMFPAEYRNDAFVTMRGSWNRNPPAGYEVVRVRHDAAGNPTAVVPFASGWLLEDGRAHFGRPVGLLVAADGALLVGDDANGVLYRVTYAGGT